MMNLQDLHSVISNRIPLKIIIFNNDGYLMIKHTQNAIVNGRRAGTDPSSGLSCPNYEPLVKAFGFNYQKLVSGDNSKDILVSFMAIETAAVLEVFMSPDQLLVPKLSVSTSDNGKLISPPLEDLSPLLPIEILETFLQVPIHSNSISLSRNKTETKGDALY
jgi:acetolactate synthase-1/2/3 large subunit